MLAEGIPNDQLRERVVDILHRISGADPASITPDARLIEDIGIDSLGYYEIKIEAETCFSTRIQEISSRGLKSTLTKDSRSLM